MGGYPNIVLITSCHAFFFNKKMACSSSVSAFMANTLNLIMKSTIFFFPCLNVSIFHLASAAFVLLLNVVFISFTKSSQSWVPSSSSSSSSFHCVYIPTIPPLRDLEPYSSAILPDYFLGLLLPLVLVLVLSTSLCLFIHHLCFLLVIT